MVKGSFCSVWDDDIIVESEAEVDLDKKIAKLGDYCTEEDRYYGAGDGVNNLYQLTEEYILVNGKKYAVAPELEEVDEVYDKYGRGIIRYSLR